MPGYLGIRHAIAAARTEHRRAVCKVMFLTGLFSMLTCPATGESAPREIRNLGRSRAVSEPLETASDLQTTFEELRSDYLELLEKAGWEGDPADLFQAIEEGRFTERTFPVGGRLPWMSYRKPAGQITFYSNVVWAGEAPFEAFEVRLLSNDWRWAFIIPKACGNLALLSRTGGGDLDVSVTSGVLELIDPEGRPIVIHGGETKTVTAPLQDLGAAQRGEAGFETSVEVEEGSLELRDYGHPISVTVDEGSTVSATLSPTGRLLLAVPESNPGPLPIRVGDAIGTLSAGAGMSSGWSEDAEPPAVRIGFTTPRLAPRSGINAHWIAGMGAEIEVQVTEGDNGIEYWTPRIDDQETSLEALRGPWTVGEHTLAVVAVDGLGKRHQTDPIRFRYDVEPPELSWGVEGLGPIGPAGSLPEEGQAGHLVDDSESPPPSLRGRRLLRIGKREWEADSDHTQVVIRPQHKKDQHFEGIDVPLGPEQGVWILAEDDECSDAGSLSYDLVAGDDGGVVLRVAAVDCAGNSRRGRLNLTRAEKKR